MVPEMYGDLLDGDDDSLGFEYTEILGDEFVAGDDDALGDLLDGDDEAGAFVGDNFIPSSSGASWISRNKGKIAAAAAAAGLTVAAYIALKKRAAAKKAAAANALMAKRVSAGSLLRGVPPRASREYALGLGSTSVAGNSSANINVQPQVIFRPERLVVPSNLAVDFLITDIKVGKNSQLVSTGALPAVMFTEVAFGVRLKMDTCQISMFVTISVTNQNPAARNFQGGIVGPAVE
jgi:hypothetical protein